MTNIDDLNVESSMTFGPKYVLFGPGHDQRHEDVCDLVQSLVTHTLIVYY
jgi:hypothetical protein